MQLRFCGTREVQSVCCAQEDVRGKHRHAPYLCFDKCCRHRYFSPQSGADVCFDLRR